MSSEVEHVLVVPTELFLSIGAFQGFNPNTKPYLDVLLDKANISFRPRPEMESDPSFKQLIPYCIFKYQDYIFSYERGTAQGENRLHGKISIGVGGHICSSDGNATGDVYRDGLVRELKEEVSLTRFNWKQVIIGLINDDSNEVGRVHLGVVHLFELQSPNVWPQESSMHNPKFRTKEDLLSLSEYLEPWSKICLNYLFLKGSGAVGHPLWIYD